jgi:hypothetical protein
MKLENDLADILLWKFADVDAPRAVGESYESLSWLSTTVPKPTREDIKEWDALYTKHKKENRYKLLRKYPSVEEQLDMIWHDIDGWKKTIGDIKNKAPKPKN